MTDPGTPPAIEGYRVGERLGHGAMGTVWRAVDRKGRSVAVKVADRAGRVPAARRDALFRREALVALNLRHPSIVRGLEVGETGDGQAFLAMEFVEGETLRHRLTSRGPLPAHEIVAIGLAVASALEYAHGLGLLHRDLKPENVMLRSDGSVCVVDFGLAVEVEHADFGIGTPGYASPEVLLARTVGPRSDLYSLGVTLASAAWGRPFFEGRDARAVARANLRRAVTLPETLPDGPVSEGLRAVVARLTRKAPSERYQSAGECRLDFEALSRGERPLGAILGLARNRTTRRPKLWVGAGILAVAAIAVALFVPFGGAVRPSPASPPLPGGATATSSPVVDDPRIETTLLYLASHPEEIAAGRRLVAEARSASPSDRQRTRLDEAAARIEGRARAAAEAALRERRAEAQALAARGDFGRMESVLSSWPEELKGLPEEAQAKSLVDVLRAGALAPGERLIAEASAALERLRAGDEGDAAAAAGLSTRIDRFLESDSSFPEQRARLAGLRPAIAREVRRLHGAKREDACRKGLAAYRAAAAAGDATRARTVLEEIADPAEDAPRIAQVAAKVAGTGREVDAALSRRLTGLAHRPWAGVLDGRWFVGPIEDAPSPRLVFLPVLPPATASPKESFEFGEILGAEPDAERAASWLVLSAVPDAALALAPEGGSARRLLEAVGFDVATPGHPRDGAWARLSLRIPFLLRRPDDPPPAAPADRDPLVDAWRASIVAPGRASPRPAPATSLPSVVAARAAFVAEDWLGAWSALESAASASPTDVEVAMLRCRVLDALAKPLRTRAVSLIGLSEARRAWDLDPTVPAASRLVAEQSLLFRARHPGPSADALAPVALAACEEAARLGQADVSMLTFAGERRLAESKPKVAVQWLRRAAREAPQDTAVALLLARAEDGLGDGARARETLLLAKQHMGDKFPAWAQEMLNRLSSR